MRYRIDRIAGEWRSVGGPDYENESEWRVVDQHSSAVVITFHEYGDWPYLTAASYSGTDSVTLGDDGYSVVVMDHDGTRKVLPLPGHPAFARARRRTGGRV